MFMKALRTICNVLVVIGIFAWFLTPFFSAGIFASSDGVPASTLVLNSNSDYFSFLNNTWKTTALYWMPLACTVLLGVCLLFILLKDSRWVCVFSSVSIVALIAGGVLASQLKLRGLYLGSGFFLMVAVFAVLLSCSILEMRDIKNKKIAENALVPEDDM